MVPNRLSFALVDLPGEPIFTCADLPQAYLNEIRPSLTEA